MALGLGYISITRSIAENAKRHDPARAYQLAPNDGQVAGLLAQQRFAEHPTPDKVIMDLARSALRHDPTIVPAVTTLAFQLEAGGDKAAAHRLFAYAEKLSRRDLPTHVWAIEDAVSRGDVKEALRHYDLALRTSRAAPDLMFPILSQAIAEPAVRAGLATTLSHRPIWGPSFLAFLAGSKADPGAIADLLIRASRSGLPVPTEPTAAAVGGLLDKGDFEAAWRFYTALRPGTDRARSRDPRFTDAVTTPSAFDWTPVNDAVITTSIQRDRRGGLFDFAIPPGTGGALLTQVQVLPPGTYRLSGHSRDIQQPRSSLPYWALTCRDGRELGRVEVLNSSDAGGMFEGQFSVPAGCPVQTLAMVARPSDAVSGSTGQIDRVQLVPARR